MVPNILPAFTIRNVKNALIMYGLLRHVTHLVTRPGIGYATLYSVGNFFGDAYFLEVRHDENRLYHILMICGLYCPKGKFSVVSAAAQPIFTLNENEMIVELSPNVPVIVLAVQGHANEKVQIHVDIEMASTVVTGLSATDNYHTHITASIDLPDGSVSNLRDSLIFPVDGTAYLHIQLRDAQIFNNGAIYKVKITRQYVR